MKNFTIIILLLIPCLIFPGEIRLTCTADLAIRQHKAALSTDFVESNLGKAPALPFHGIHYTGGPKEIGSILLFNFDIAALKSKLPGKATLYLRGENDLSKMKIVSVSTVSAPWVEGTGIGVSPEQNGAGAAAHWASYKQRRWIETDPQSELIDVGFGLGNSRWEFVRVRQLSDGWIAIDIPQKIMAALNVGASHGIALMEEKGQTEIKYRVYSRESAGNEPYILVSEITAKSRELPQPVTNISAKSAPDLATLETGALSISFDDPASDAAAYRVTAKYQDKAIPVQRYMIPFPQESGTSQKIELSGLMPEEMVYISVTVLDGAGNQSVPMKVSSKTSAVLPTPTPLPVVKKEIKVNKSLVVGNNIKIWAYGGNEKAHPVSGNLLEEVGRDKYSGQPEGNYRNGNYIWNGRQQQVELAGGRNEFVTFNLCIEAADGLSGAQLRLGEFFHSSRDKKLGLQFSNIYRNWYVRDGQWMPEIALPLSGSFSIPAEDNKIPGQKNQSFLVEIFIPHQAAAGLYNGSLFFEARGVDVIKIPLKLTVQDFVLPDRLSFDVELNVYDWRACERDYFRLAHYHRTTLNVLPYWQRGEVKPGAAPEIEGRGAEIKAVDWQAYDRRYSALFDGSAFDNLPRKGVPIRLQYLPMHENWPAKFYDNLKYQPQATDYKKWLTEIALNAPRIGETFAENYEQAFVEITRQFAAHFKEKGWKNTEMQFYLNNKNSFTKGKMGWWILDEPQHIDDVLALQFFGRLFKAGLTERDQTKFAYRCDISRPQLIRLLLDDLCDCMYVSRAFFTKNNLCQRMKRRGVKLIQYGHANRISMTNLTSVLWSLRSYVFGADGVLPWNSIGEDDCFYRPQAVALLISGKPVGLNTVVASLRLKALRRGQQDIEYLKLLEQKKGYNRRQIRKLVSDVLSLKSTVVTKDGHYFEDAGMISFDAVRGRQLDELRRAVASVLTQ